ncbi:MAG: HEAT repeat domain-containing protein [Planctomycetes bacterium]|nr:HEAT repeat domain-containing protein [Planctomycetota bacterium]
MKPAAVAFLCLACSLLSAAVAYGIYTTMREEPRPAPVAAPLDDSATQDRVAQLEDELAKVKDELSVLRNRPAHAPARSEPEVPAPSRTVIEEESEQEDNAASEAELQKRIEAILAERDKDTEAARNLLEQNKSDLTGSDSDKRREAAGLLAALAQQGDDSAKEALLAALKSTDPEVREDVLEALGKLGMAEFLPVLQEAATDEAPGVRAEVAAALGKLPAEQAGPLLVSMLADADAKVLRKAADSLGDLKYEPATRDLQLLTRHEDERVAIEAAVALRRIGDTNAAESWVPTLGGRLLSSDATERREAVKQLRRMKLESARPYLEQALNDENEAVRKEAKKGLKDLK